VVGQNIIAERPDLC